MLWSADVGPQMFKYRAKNKKSNLMGTNVDGYESLKSVDDQHRGGFSTGDFEQTSAARAPTDVCPRMLSCSVLIHKVESRRIPELAVLMRARTTTK